MKNKNERTEINTITQQIIDAGLEVHKTLGPGLLESIYEDCLVIELESRGLKVERQKPVPVIYKGKMAGQPYRLDLLVADCVIVEVKNSEKIIPIYQAQLLTYMRLQNVSVGLILNFNTVLLRDGIKRMVNDFDK
jgi:GxxExxY protein